MFFVVRGTISIRKTGKKSKSKINSLLPAEVLFIQDIVFKYFLVIIVDILLFRSQKFKSDEEYDPIEKYGVNKSRKSMPPAVLAEKLVYMHTHA